MFFLKFSLQVTMPQCNLQGLKFTSTAKSRIQKELLQNANVDSGSWGAPRFRQLQLEMLTCHGNNSTCAAAPSLPTNFFMIQKSWHCTTTISCSLPNQFSEDKKVSQENGSDVSGQEIYRVWQRTKTKELKLKVFVNTLHCDEQWWASSRLRAEKHHIFGFNHCRKVIFAVFSIFSNTKSSEILLCFDPLISPNCLRSNASNTGHSPSHKNSNGFGYQWQSRR